MSPPTTASKNLEGRRETAPGTTTLLEFESPSNETRKTVFVGAFFLLVASLHWLVPTDADVLHAVHIALRKLFILPVVLGGLWFGFRGGMWIAGLSWVVYLPHVLLQWHGQWTENLSQLGEAVSWLLIGAIVGWLSDRENTASRDALAASEAALHALVRALDAREHHTGQHSLRVAAYARVLGEALGLSKFASRQLVAGAFLHDIGKIGIPDRILGRAGPLSDHEWVEMKRHPEIGFRILPVVLGLEKAWEVVLHHHEQVDGSGYPNGLRGEHIPVAARVFSVVDAFDALTSDRPYRSAVSYGEARVEIERGAGTHFDSRVVDAFLRIPGSRWSEVRAEVNGDSLAMPAIPIFLERGQDLESDYPKHLRDLELAPENAELVCDLGQL